jgi:hypothetical protein
MVKKLALFFFMTLLANNIIYSQSVDGFWEGHLTVEDGDKVLMYCDLRLHLTTKNDTIKGKSIISFADKTAVYEVVGYSDKNILVLSEINLQYHDSLPNGEWCKKKMSFYLDADRQQTSLIGAWQGKTTFSDCRPGKIFLKRGEERP